ncbi:hypothetical protein Q4Q35_13950 [Flavivirga aquimarina]|uniref:Uncharacterized protein n=1 Tax=Flavivirga aquimarina TaxID=2027862 RepID=A0ABT8WCR4_9FLAO|nr:hypothetical protein [Flavivirga aquimarina]MDO5970910.1 hypothetical protein [Flavivirga aquimarina]
MNISSVIFKSTVLATCIFWIVIMSQGFQNYMIPLVFLSMIPISICCAITIFLTIVPFFWVRRGELVDEFDGRNRIIFKKYFPFYAIVSFSLCLYGIVESIFAISFFVSAFFTTMQSWVWLAKDNEKQNN